MRRLMKPPVASVRLMAIRRRRRRLDLRPAAEWHEKFVQEHADADQLLAEADEYLAEREAEYQRELARREAAATELIEQRVRKAIDTTAGSSAGSRMCGARTISGGPCQLMIAPGTRKCAAGHTPRS